MKQSILCGCTVGEYIRNRRLSLSREDVLSKDMKIIDIAFKYGYSTPEGFTRAFYMFYGKPDKRVVLFTNVNGIDKLYSFVKENGWDEITEIKEQPWGGRTCNVTTIDGSIITFCEPI